MLARNRKLVICFYNSKERWCQMTWNNKKNIEGITFAYSPKGRDLGIETENQIVANMQDGMPGFNVIQYFESQPGVFSNYDHLHVAWRQSDQKYVGLLGSKWLQAGNINYLYLWTAMVGSAYWGKSVFARLMRSHFNQIFCVEQIKPKIIATKTYNPVVYKNMRKVFNRTAGVSFYPEIPDLGNSNQDMKKTAIDIATGLGKDLVFDADLGVLRGGQAAVSPDYFPDMPAKSDEPVGEYFEKHVPRSDQVLCVFNIPESSVTELAKNNKWDEWNDINKSS